MKRSLESGKTLNFIYIFQIHLAVMLGKSFFFNFQIEKETEAVCKFYIPVYE